MQQGRTPDKPRALPPPRAASLALDEPHHLPLVGKAVGGFLGKNQIAVYHDFEHAIGAFDEVGLDRQGILQFRGQTGRVGLVVSNPAIFNIDLHPTSSTD